MPSVTLEPATDDSASTRATIVPRTSETRALSRESRATSPISSASPASISQVAVVTALLRPIVDLHTGAIYAYTTVFRGPFGDEDATAVFQEAATLKSAGKLGRTLREALFARCPEATMVVSLQRAELNDSWLIRPDDPLYAWENTVYVEIPMPAIADLKHAKGILGEMRSRGVRLVLTGVGVGRGALKGMSELKPHLVKLHPDVTAELDGHGPMQRVVAGLVHDCVSLGARVVADGVSSYASMSAAREAGARYAQGDYFGQPAIRPPRYDWTRLNGRGPAR